MKSSSGRSVTTPCGIPAPSASGTTDADVVVKTDNVAVLVEVVLLFDVVFGLAVALCEESMGEGELLSADKDCEDSPAEDWLDIVPIEVLEGETVERVKVVPPKVGPPDPLPLEVVEVPLAGGGDEFPPPWLGGGGDSIGP